jgi:hypothetical protein
VDYPEGDFVDEEGYDEEGVDCLGAGVGMVEFGD